MRLSDKARNTKLNALTGLMNGARLEIYEGAYPSHPAAPITTQHTLASVRFANPAFHPAANGSATAWPVGAEEAAPASGRATWFRIVTADGTTVLDGLVGPGEASLRLSSPEIVIGSRVELTTLILTESATEA